METIDPSLNQSKQNILSSGEPKVQTNQGNTSTEPTSSENTGESVPQQGQDIVNEQEQNKTTNMEEYIQNSAQNRMGNDEGATIQNNENANDDVNDTNKKIPSMKSGVL